MKYNVRKTTFKKTNWIDFFFFWCFLWGRGVYQSRISSKGLAATLAMLIFPEQPALFITLKMENEQEEMCGVEMCGYEQEEASLNPKPRTLLR